MHQRHPLDRTEQAVGAGLAVRHHLHRRHLAAPQFHPAADTGLRVVGFQPAEAFAKVLDAALAR